MLFCHVILLRYCVMLFCHVILSRYSVTLFCHVILSRYYVTLFCHCGSRQMFIIIYFVCYQVTLSLWLSPCLRHNTSHFVTAVSVTLCRIVNVMSLCVIFSGLHYDMTSYIGVCDANIIFCYIISSYITQRYLMTELVIVVIICYVILSCCVLLF